MAKQLTAEDARLSMTAHVEAKGVEAYVKYGPNLDAGRLEALLADRALVRYPCRIVFDAAPLQPGEFAHPEQEGDSPEAGFTMFVHPCLAESRAPLAYAVLYQLVAVNYGEFASADDAETFGAAALGLTRDEYYEALCALSDQLGGIAPEIAEPSGGTCGGGCSCGH